MTAVELTVREWVYQVKEAPRSGDFVPSGKVTIRHQLDACWVAFVPGTRCFHPDSDVPPLGSLMEWHWDGDPVGHMPDWLAKIAAGAMQDESAGSGGGS